MTDMDADANAHARVRYIACRPDWHALRRRVPDNAACGGCAAHAHTLRPHLRQQCAPHILRLEDARTNARRTLVQLYEQNDHVRPALAPLLVRRCCVRHTLLRRRTVGCTLALWPVTATLCGGAAQVAYLMQLGDVFAQLGRECAHLAELRRGRRAQRRVVAEERRRGRRVQVGDAGVYDLRRNDRPDLTADWLGLAWLGLAWLSQVNASTRPAQEPAPEGTQRDPRVRPHSAHAAATAQPLRLNGGRHTGVGAT